LRISGMTCNHCVRSVGQALREVPGVTSAHVDLPDRASVEHGPGVSEDALVAAVRAAGYDVLSRIA
jgi:copper chaperone